MACSRSPMANEIGRAHSELQSHSDLVCRLLLEKKKIRNACLSSLDITSKLAPNDFFTSVLGVLFTTLVFPFLFFKTTDNNFSFSSRIKVSITLSPGR